MKKIEIVTFEGRIRDWHIVQGVYPSASPYGLALEIETDEPIPPDLLDEFQGVDIGVSIVLTLEYPHD